MGTHMGLGGDTWASAIKTVSYCLRTTDSLMALSSCMDHGPQHGLRRVPHGTHISMAPRITNVHRNHQGIRHGHRLHVSTWISNFIASWGSSMDHQHQHGIQLYHRPWCLSRMSNSECEPFFISGIIIAKSQGDPMAEESHGLHIYFVLNNIY